MTDSTIPPVPIADQIAFTSELVRVYRTMLLDPTNAATSQQHLEVGARTLSAVVSTLQRVAASADDGK
jgi:hypothetical protein